MKRAVEAHEKQKVSKSKSSSGASNMFRTEVIEGYSCILSSNCQNPSDLDLAVVLFHGFGATAEEFKFFPDIASSIGKKVGWIFPQASPGSMGASEWWQLDGQYTFHFQHSARLAM